ncbi:DUF2461 domain-containing protein [Roseibium sp. M-1]
MTGNGFQPETFRFLGDLAANNSRDWFDAHKAAYQTFVKKPADGFRSDLSARLAELTGRDLSSKQFRINRDLRFSNDKTPYNTNIRMAFWPSGGAFEGKDAQPPSFFLSVEADHIRVGAGCMAFAKPVLGRFLSRLETGGGDEIAGLLSEARSLGFDISAPDLAKVPRGFPKEHPNSNLARHKGLAVWKDLGDVRDVQGPDGANAVMAALEPAMPVWRWLMDLHEGN